MGSVVRPLSHRTRSSLASELLERADRRIAIPTPGPVESLNAAVAASILLYEAARQRSAKKS